MFGILFFIAQGVALLGALVRSTRERFAVGVLGGAARAVLVATTATYDVRAGLASIAGRGELPAGHRLAAAVAAILGPAVTFAVLFAAHRRTQGVPAAEEERLGRPFNAWLLVGIIDGLLVVLGLLAHMAAMDI
jgi:hypothetical protein